MFSAAIENHTSQLQNILVELDSGTPCGIPFESLAHRRLLEGGDSQITPLTYLPSQTLSSQTLSIAPDMNCHLFEENKLDLLLDAYNLPLSKTYPTIDAAISKLRVLFQMTVASDHPIKWSGLEKHIQYFSRDTQRSCSLHLHGTCANERGRAT